MKLLSELLTTSEILLFLTNLHKVENILSLVIEHNIWKTPRLSCPSWIYILNLLQMTFLSLVVSGSQILVSDYYLYFEYKIKNMALNELKQ